MAMRHKEKPEQYKKRMIDVVSPSYCAAKWYMATINLGAGMSRSCHYPDEHPIPLEEVRKDYRAIHNTQHKMEKRKQMLCGERPKECSYCWRVEDMKVDGTVPDRVFYTSSFDDELVATPADLPWDEMVTPRNLEVAFDRVCNFACSYCGPNFSTTWAKDLKTNGPYKLIQNGTYDIDGSEHEPYGKMNEDNPYVEAFWKWWPELSQTLKIFRITGGEPTMSPHFWKLVDKIRADGVNPDMEIAVNTNLGAKFDLIQKLTEFSHDVPTFQLYVSSEGHGEQGEYIRDGLDYDYWLSNMNYFLENGKSRQVTIMTTISAISLWSLTDFMDDMLELKQRFGDDHPLVSINMLRQPVFMAMSVLPQHLKEDRKKHLSDWYIEHASDPGMTDYDRYSFRKLIAYLEKAPSESKSHVIDEQNFFHFHRQYDQRRGKSFKDTFPGPLVEWYESLERRFG